MRLKEIFAEGFRCFGSDTPLKLDLDKGITSLVGENDSGKSAIIDAIRLALGTRGEDYLRLHEADFHVSREGRTDSLTIRCTLVDLSEEEESQFLEWCTLGSDGELQLFVTLTARQRGRIWYERRSGFAGEGPAIDGELREFLRVTYLRPLRDAERELRPGRRSRLSQILAGLPEMDGQEARTEGGPTKDSETLADVLASADERISENTAIKKIEGRINKDLTDLALGEDNLDASLGLGRQSTLGQLLERLELLLSRGGDLPEKVPRGLGMNNLLFMAAELLLLESQGDALRLLLVEEPEAHLHPQLQVRFMSMLQDRLGGDTNVQALLTTHSPVLAAGAPVESLVLTAGARTYPLAKGQTKLDPSDYDFLRRFLDATKANLFFAKGVLIVEGDAENLLLPAIAARLGRPLSKHGVSIVKVGHRGLFRYSRVFQREDGTQLPIPVACIADRDVPPDAAKTLPKPPKKTEGDWSAEQLEEKVQRLQALRGGPVEVFVSPQWTLEYDLALKGLAVEVLQAVRVLTGTGERKKLLEEARNDVLAWCSEGRTPEEIALDVYRPFRRRKVSKAEAAEQLAFIIHKLPDDTQTFRNRLPQYLVEAIEYVTGGSTSTEELEASSARRNVEREVAPA